MITEVRVPPTYAPEMKRILGVLQQLQVLLADSTRIRSVTLADVSGLITTIQNEFGTQAELEDVIQTLVARDLAGQYSRRRRGAVS